MTLPVTYTASDSPSPLCCVRLWSRCFRPLYSKHPHKPIKTHKTPRTRTPKTFFRLSRACLGAALPLVAGKLSYWINYGPTFFRQTWQLHCVHRRAPDIALWNLLQKQNSPNSQIHFANNMRTLVLHPHNKLGYGSRVIRTLFSGVYLPKLLLYYILFTHIVYNYTHWNVWIISLELQPNDHTYYT